MNSGRIARKDYMRLQEIFNPQQFDASEWMDAIEMSGAKYFVM